MGSYTMTLKAITTLLFACLVIHQTFGCLNEIVRDDFNSMDKDQSGFLTRNEVFEACSSDSISEKECEKGWKSMDLNNDGQALCQESFVGALAMIEGLQSGKVGETFRRIFADKPENCDEVSKEEVEKFVMTRPMINLWRISRYILMQIKMESLHATNFWTVSIGLFGKMKK